MTVSERFVERWLYKLFTAVNEHELWLYFVLMSLAFLGCFCSPPRVGGGKFTEACFVHAMLCRVTFFVHSFDKLIHSVFRCFIWGV